MTRINLIPPSELHYKHLIAEYRELPRIFTLVRKAIARGESPDDPRNPMEYTLGQGHCRFFYDKIRFLWVRFDDLEFEMWHRNYKPTYNNADIWDIPEEWCNDYVPTETAIAINRARINQRLEEMNVKARHGIS